MEMFIRLEIRFGMVLILLPFLKAARVHIRKDMMRVRRLTGLWIMEFMNRRVGEENGFTRIIMHAIIMMSFLLCMGKI